MPEICKIEVTKDDLKKIHDLGIGYSLKAVDVDDFDYSNDKTWVKLKYESSKAFKALKEREFIIRNKMI